MGTDGKQLTETTRSFNLGGRLQPWLPSAQGLAPVFMLMVSAHVAFPQHRTRAPGGRCCFSSCLPGPGHTLLPSDLPLSSPEHGVLGPLPRKAWASGWWELLPALGDQVPDSRPVQRRGEVPEGRRRGRTRALR